MESKHRTVHAIRTTLTDAQAWALVIAAEHAVYGHTPGATLVERAQEAAGILRDHLCTAGLTKLEVQRRERWFN